MKFGRVCFLALGFSLWPVPVGLRGGEQPAVDAAQEELTPVDFSGESALTFTARGGECPPPGAEPDDPGGTLPVGSNWQKDGDPFYIWSYNDGPGGLLGRPAPDELPALDTADRQDTLRLDSDEGGSVEIIVHAVQRWRTGDGRTAITCSPTS